MLSRLLQDKKTLIVVGSGGVGKTTTSAALAVQAARSGLKTLVLTVDPARRLANSLGLEELGNQEIQISPELFEASGIELNGGALFGMMLDTKSTFDALIEQHAPSEEVKQRIFDNPFYEQASTALAGSQEYMAMEKLYELRERGDYDLIVLDTPPTPNALDFLTAPNRLEDFLSSATTRTLLKGMKAAGRLGFGLLKLNALVMRGLNRFVGADTFLGLVEFIQSFQGMYGGFKERAGRVRQLLRSDDVAFIIVTTTSRAAIDEGTFFYRQLKASEMPFGAVVVNRVRSSFLDEAELEGLDRHLIEASRACPPLKRYDGYHVARVLKRAAAACQDYETLARMDIDRLALIQERFSEDRARVFPVPLFERDVHDLGSLARFADHVFSAPPSAAIRSQTKGSSGLSA